MNNDTRREFLRLGINSSALVALSSTVPTFLSKLAYAAETAPHPRERILVMLELNGGNDGLNTVVPFTDDLYYRSRPTLALPANTLHRIDDRVGFAASLSGFNALLQDDALAVVQNVGYPNPNRSHFDSMMIWQTANLDGSRDITRPAGVGWLARSLELLKKRRHTDVDALHLSPSPVFEDPVLREPQSLLGRTINVSTIKSLADFQTRVELPTPTAARRLQRDIDKMLAAKSRSDNSIDRHVQRVMANAIHLGEKLQRVTNKETRPDAVSYPVDSDLSDRLRVIARFIKSGFSVPVYYTAQGSRGATGAFDTHSRQADVHQGLLQELGDSLHAFMRDLRSSGLADQVLVVVFSEFGRRVQENESKGTDHGAAAPVFLVGDNVKAGLTGAYPDLARLDDGDLRYSVDFRRLYATILDGWLGLDSAACLGERFEHLELLT